MCKIKELISRAKELGQTSVAITDHGSLYGLWVFQEECIKQGIKPILGCEFYFDNGFDENLKPKRGHLILLAKNNVGLQNLYKLQEIAYEEHFYFKHVITLKDLKEHSEGLICTSACLANLIPDSIINGEYTKARQHALELKEIFGADFYLELQTNTIMEQHIVNKELVAMGKQLDIPIIVTNDVHYVLKDDYDVHEVLLAIGTQKKMDDPKRWKFPTNDFWFKSEEEMRNGLNGISVKDIDVSINNTNVIADLCNASIDRGKFLPKYPFLEDGETADNRFSKNVIEGYKKKLTFDEQYHKEIIKEMKVITDEGYSDYFLIVEDYIKRAREADLLVGDGRGSGAGSKSCYALDITRVEPDEYGLLFERFLATGREPDIDSDFSDIDAVFELLGEAYGWENVARIVSFGTFAPKAVNRKILSIFGHDIFSVVNPICKLLSDNPLATWDDALKNEEYLKAIKQYPREWKCIQRLQGNVTNTSMHAGGVIIWNKVSDVLPVKCILDMNGIRRKRVVCFDMDALHDIGHFKFDILGLNTLETQDMCLKNIKEIHGVDIDFSKINYEDENVIKMIASGDLTGIFQLEEQVERVMQQNPKNFRDIIAINALIRPGTGNNYFARRNGIQQYSLYSQQESYMSETYGDYVYQEQYLMDCKVFAGWSIAFADKKVRKNRNIFSDLELKEKFLTDCLQVGILNSTQSDDMWHNICEAVNGGYAFNKSHSTTYARIAYQNAYMKYYYPECFYSALLTKNGDKPIKVGEIIAECKLKSIKILPPNINESGNSFRPGVDGIYYRLNTIKGLGDSALAEIIRLREISSIRGLEDLCERRIRGQLKNNNIEALIKAGVFDFENADRQEIMYQFDLLNRTPKQIKDGYEPERRAYSKSRWEYESFGFFLTEHALDKYAFKKLDAFTDGQPCLVAGIVQPNPRIFRDKNGKEMAFITISNQFESIKLICFSSVWNDTMKILCEENNVIYVKGKRQGKDVIVNELFYIDKL